MLKKLLDSPIFYQLFQEAGGFFGARVKAISEFIEIKPGMRILDIGCGPGYILRYLPKDIDFIGFDIDQSYIDHANAKFGQQGRFYCRLFDEHAAQEFAPVDIVMMNGVLHHIPDADLVKTLANVHAVLRPNGLLFTLDGCYREDQSRFRRWMLDNDRGEFVRDEAGYRNLLAKTFGAVNLHIRENYSRVPYTFVVGLALKV